jgi:hypothetical protein
MALDETLEKSEIAAQLEEEMERSVQSMLLRSGFTAAISRIPLGVGDGINAMLAELAISRIHQRMYEMFEEVASRIAELSQEQVSREWFRSEEFQTLLFEAINQLHVTHDREKIRMLGNALANSGTTRFSTDQRKEVFVQLIRDLTSEHVRVLHRLAAPPAESFGPELDSDTINWIQWERRPSLESDDRDLLLLQTLAGRGLVEERLESAPISHIAVPATESQALEEFFKQLQKPPRRLFRLSHLGNDFLEFVGGSKSST